MEPPNTQYPLHINQPVSFVSEDCIYIADNDDAFKARMRFHQSWYRRHVLGLPPGSNPYAKKKAIYGNTLCAEDAAHGKNFLTEAIYAHVQARLQQKSGLIELKRTMGNLLGSQPMCFNLFAPLVDDLALATQLLRALPGVSPEIHVTQAMVEYAPPKATHLNDRTAFDAWVEYQYPDGRLGFIGIETKLTEPFSRDKYTYAPCYSRWQNTNGWWWRLGAEMHFSTEQYNQLWRNHLLAYAMLHQPTSRYSEAYCAVLAHPADSACTDAMTAYRQHLTSDGDATLLDWPLDTVVATWLKNVETRQQRDWLQAFNLRYLDLDASEPAWQQFQETRR